MFLRIGLRIHPQADTLHCAAGLFESKHGDPGDATRHLLCAVKLNPTKHQPLLKWKRLKNIGQVNATSLRPSRIKPFHDVQQNARVSASKVSYSLAASVTTKDSGHADRCTLQASGVSKSTGKEWRITAQRWVAAESERLESEKGPYAGWRKKTTLEQLSSLLEC